MKASVVFLRKLSSLNSKEQLINITKRIDQADKWLLSLASGFSLFFVLFIYKAYNIQEGLSYSGHSLLFRSMAFGLVTFLSFFIHEFYLSTHFRLTNAKRKLAWLSWEIFMGANFTFLLFNYFWNWTEWDWNGYFLLLLEYTCVLTFPILFVHVFTKKLKNNAVDNSRLHFSSENGKHQLSLKPKTFLYIKSGDNYVEVFYVSHNKVKCELLRNTLKAIEGEYTGSPYLLRCHRSFMVNPTQINHIVSANQQMQVELEHGISIPVSQKYRSKFDSNIPSVHSPRI